MTPTNYSGVPQKDGNGDDDGMDDMGFNDFGKNQLAMSSAVDSQENRDKVGSMVFEDQSVDNSVNESQ